MSSNRLLQIKKKLEELIQKDTEFQTFGSDEPSNGHQYQLNPILSQTKVTEFESAHQIRLPEEYREFLTKLANGGAGPYYGLYSLEKGIKEAEDYSTDENESLKNPFTQDFPLSNEQVQKFIDYYDAQVAEGNDDDIDYPAVPDPFTGVIFLSEFGCGWSYCLVVKGEQAGTIWFHGDYLAPCLSGGKQQTFFDWYEEWLDNSLKDLEPVTEEPPPFDVNKTIVNYDGWNLTAIPEEVFSCKNLKKLVMSRNKLKEFPQRVTEFAELTTLDLSMTPIKKIPDEIGQLKNLKRLFLNYNYHRQLPADLAKLKKLEELSMFYNYKIKAIPDVVTEIPSLKILKFSYCGELRKVPPKIGNLKNLELLDLKECGQLEKLPDSLIELENLKHLYLDNTKVTRLPDGFDRLQNLESLSLGLGITDWAEIVEKIKKLPKLKWLRISMELEYSSNFSELTNIRQLVISQNYHLWHQGHERFPLAESICLIPNLEELDLMNCNQASALPENIGKLAQLRKLEIHSTAIKRFPDSIKNLTRLEQVQGNLDKEGDSEFGILPAEKEKLQSWFPKAKIWIW